MDWDVGVENKKYRGPRKIFVKVKQQQAVFWDGEAGVPENRRKPRPARECPAAKSRGCGGGLFSGMAA